MTPELRHVWRILVFIVAVLGIQELQLLFLVVKWYNSNDPGSKTPEICGPAPPEVTCDPLYKYRNVDGSCNNLKHPAWGQSKTKQHRFLPPRYDDGCQSPRQTGYDHLPLPSPRDVSNILFQNRNSTTTHDPKLNILHMSFGQFLDHDLVLTPVTGGLLSCCGEHIDRPECIPIHIPSQDPFFTNSCMPLSRSAWTYVEHGHNCCREQINDVTSFIDASNVYGSSEQKARALRTFQNGTLRDRNGGLPDGGTSKCVFNDVTTDYCQDAGDVRVNVVPNLGSVHLLFLRYHNYIAGQIATLNPSWDDETLYQETRAIVTAILQHVVYKEYLPLVVGDEVMAEYGLNPSPAGYNTVYDEDINLSTRNAFAAAAFRFGHSQVTNHQKQYNKTYFEIASLNIEDTYHSPHFCVYNGGTSSEGILRWQLAEQAAKSDRVFESGVRDRLFREPDGTSLDLPAINVQRGRDHGLPPYIKWREFCGLSVNLSDHSYIEKLDLKNVYRDIRDIDLYAGAMTELPVPGGIVGPTFACLIARQFLMYKKGDRFWYENNHTHGFTEDQLTEIKKATLSSVLCQSIDVDQVSLRAFIIISDTNPTVNCSSLIHPYWTPWREKAKTS